MPKSLEVNSENFKQEVLESDLPVLADFWAPWCQPCQILSPILEELAEDMKDKIKVVRINVDEVDNQSLASKYQVQGIPSLKIFKEGEIAKEMVGLKPKEVLKQEIESIL